MTLFHVSEDKVSGVALGNKPDSGLLCRQRVGQFGQCVHDLQGKQASVTSSELGSLLHFYGGAHEGSILQHCNAATDTSSTA